MFFFEVVFLVRLGVILGPLGGGPTLNSYCKNQYKTHIFTFSEIAKTSKKTSQNGGPKAVKNVKKREKHDSRNCLFFHVDFFMIFDEKWSQNGKHKSLKIAPGGVRGVFLGCIFERLRFWMDSRWIWGDFLADFQLIFDGFLEKFESILR